MSRFVRTYARRKAFLDELEVGSSYSKAAMAARGTVGNFKAWEKSDPDFAKDVEDAVNSGTDFIEDVATARAIDKSDALMAMILKARRPDKYDRGSKLELSGQLNVEGSKSKLLNRLAKLQRALGGSVPEEGPEKEQEVLEAEPEEVKALPAPVPADTAVVRRKRR